MIESIDQNEFDFINELKSRTKLNYGLKYEIISIANGTATSVPSSFSSYNSNILPNNNTGLTAHLNLALSLNSELTHLLDLTFYTILKHVTMVILTVN